MSTQQVAVPEIKDTPAAKTPRGTQGGVSDPRTLIVVRVIVVAITLLWLVPAVGLLITSLRTQGAINSSGWWTVLPSGKRG